MRKVLDVIPRRTLLYAGAIAVTLLLVPLVGKSFGSSYDVNNLRGMDFKDRIEVSQTLAKLDKPASLSFSPVCTRKGSVRIKSVQPMRTVGAITLDRAGLSCPFTMNTHLQPGAPGGALPSSWNLAHPITPCTGKGVRWLALQMTRHTAASAGVVGFKINFVDENGREHTKNVPLLAMGVCGNTKDHSINC